MVINLSSYTSKFFNYNKITKNLMEDKISIILLKFELNSY